MNQQRRRFNEPSTNNLALRLMAVQLQLYDPSHRDEIVQLSLRAWRPVFPSIKNSLEPAVYQAFYPDGWEASQRRAVEAVCDDDETTVWVAIKEQT